MQEGLDTNKYMSLLKDVLVFRSLSEHEISAILPYVTIIAYGPEEKVICEGEQSSAFFAVMKGTVVVTVSQNENEVYICSLGAGDTFGEAAMFLKVKRTATITSADETIVVKMDRNDMFRYFEECPKAGNKIMMLLIYSLLKKLREANQELAFERRSDMDQNDIDALMNELGNPTGS
jgi:CRP/FNR family transcriptional regulator, cyclic AMP receptor protein